MSVLTIQFDGSCEPNNPGGVATAGFLILENGIVIASEAKFVRRGTGATNNLAEWSALGFALRWLLDHRSCAGDELILQGDSKLVVEQIAGRWKCNKDHLQKLKQRCLVLLAEIKPISWKSEWIPREQNSAADALSQRAYVETTGKKYPERSRT